MYVDEVIVMYNDRAGEDQDYYYAHDLIYSPSGLLSKDGSVVEYYEYDAYGKCTFLANDFSALGTQASGKDNPYLFTGRRLDILDSGSLKIQYSRARYYDTESGKFISRDPLGTIPPYDDIFSHEKQYENGMSLYTYAKNNPQIIMDPTGLKPWYGKYCGPGSKPGKPIDDLDRACKKHDDCYASCGGPGGVIGVCLPSRCKRNCDMNLCVNAYLSRCKGMKCKIARGIIERIFCARGVYPF